VYDCPPGRNAVRRWGHLLDGKWGVLAGEFGPGGGTVVTAEKALTSPSPDDEHYRRVVRDAATGREIDAATATGPDYDYRYAFSPAARALAFRDVVEDTLIHLVGFGRPAAGPLKNDNRKSFTDLAFHPSGKYLAATSNDGTVKLYDTASWGLATTFAWKIGRLRSVAFSPDGTLAAAGSDAGKVVVWDVDL
jgi:hypothetical protein